jgi:polysaccharide deacetylase family protein (PEP-CTERM system associated)
MTSVVNALTIDVEDYFHVAALAPAIPRETWNEREYRVERNTSRLLDLFSLHDVRATFFVLGWVAERSPKLVQAIFAAGHEVASHGFSHRPIYQQTENEFRSEAARSKHALEDLTGTEVVGYRGASFSIVRTSLWALDALIDLGFRYDSSIFPIHHDAYGIHDAAREPSKVQSPSGRFLAEFPMSTASFAGLRIPVSGGGYFRILPYWMTRAGLRQINASGRPFTFYLHPWEIDPEQPRVSPISRLSQFRHYTNLQRCEARLKRLLPEFRFAPMREVLRERGLLST